MSRKKPVHPRVCGHVHSMIYDDDYCCCKNCEQEWYMNERGQFVAYVDGRPYVERGTWKKKSSKSLF